MSIYSIVPNYSADSKEAVCFLSETDTPSRALYDEWENSLQIDLKEQFGDRISDTETATSVAKNILDFEDWVGSDALDSMSVFISGLGLVQGMIGLSRAYLKNRFITKIQDLSANDLNGLDFVKNTALVALSVLNGLYYIDFHKEEVSHFIKPIHLIKTLAAGGQYFLLLQQSSKFYSDYNQVKVYDLEDKEQITVSDVIPSLEFIQDRLGVEPDLENPTALSLAKEIVGKEELKRSLSEKCVKLLQEEAIPLLKSFPNHLPNEIISTDKLDKALAIDREIVLTNQQTKIIQGLLFSVICFQVCQSLVEMNEETAPISSILQQVALSAFAALFDTSRFKEALGSFLRYFSPRRSSGAFATDML